MNVVFYYPPVTPDTLFPTWEPLQFLYLSRMMRAQNIKVNIIDGRLFSDEQLVKQLQTVVDENTICFGITSLTCYQILKAMDAVKLVKSMFPNLPVIFGGWHATIFPEELIEYNEIDILIKGMGERSFLEVVNRLLESRKLSSFDLSDINGIYWKKANKVIKEDNRAIEPIDDLPPLLPEDFNLLNLEYYQCEKVMFYMSSRGCPYSCTYCCIGANSNKKWVGLSAEKVLFEINGLYQAYGFKELIFWDNVFFVNKKRVEDICRGFIQKEFKLSWSAHGRINEIVKWDNEFIKLLGNSGCKSVFIGIESGSQTVLDSINKQINAIDIIPALTKLKANNINVAANYMVGLPGEKHSDVKQTIKSILQCLKLYDYNTDKFQLFIYRFVAFPKTKIFNAMPNTSDMPTNSLDWGKFIHYKIKDGAAPWEGDNTNSLSASSIFYLWMGYLREDKPKTFKGKCLLKLSRLRIKTGFFRFPFEWHLWKTAGVRANGCSPI